MQKFRNGRSRGDGRDDTRDLAYKGDLSICPADAIPERSIRLGRVPKIIRIGAFELDPLVAPLRSIQSARPHQA